MKFKEFNHHKCYGIFGIYEDCKNDHTGLEFITYPIKNTCARFSGFPLHENESTTLPLKIFLEVSF